MQNTRTFRPFLSIDILIVFLILGITLIDLINGVLVMNGWFSISKPYKFFILVLMLFKLLQSIKTNYYFIIAVLAFFSFFFGYFIYFFENYNLSLLIQNFIQSTKYFIWPISFIYFRSIALENNTLKINLIFLILDFSYIIVVLNIFTGVLGFGYEFYPDYNTGTKGFFFSGNEFSLIFLLLTYIKAWKIYNINSKTFILFCLFSFFLAINIGSKTAILGILLFVLFILITRIKFNFLSLSLKKIIILIISLFFMAIAGWFFLITNKNYINNFILKRLEGYNYELVTWFLSKRNFVAIDGYEIFKENNIFYQLFGQGEHTFQTKFRLIELDFIDLLMNHGYIGLFLYTFFILLLLKTFYKSRNETIFKKLILYTYVLVIIILSNMSGHILNTGIPGFFMGLIFSLTYLHSNTLNRYYKNDYYK